MMSICEIGEDVYTENQSQQILPNYLLENKFPVIPDRDLRQIKFTKKEMLCLGLYLQGMTMKEIGKKLYRSHRTIEIHIRNIRDKLNVNSRSGVFDKVKKMGLLK